MRSASPDLSRAEVCRLTVEVSSANASASWPMDIGPSASSLLSRVYADLSSQPSGRRLCRTAIT